MKRLRYKYHIKKKIHGERIFNKYGSRLQGKQLISQYKHGTLWTVYFLAFHWRRRHDNFGLCSWGKVSSVSFLECSINPIKKYLGPRTTLTLNLILFFLKEGIVSKIHHKNVHYPSTLPQYKINSCLCWNLKNFNDSAALVVETL